MPSQVLCHGAKLLTEFHLIGAVTLNFGFNRIITEQINIVSQTIILNEKLSEAFNEVHCGLSLQIEIECGQNVAFKRGQVCHSQAS